MDSQDVKKRRLSMRRMSAEAAQCLYYIAISDGNDEARNIALDAIEEGCPSEAWDKCAEYIANLQRKYAT